MNAQQKHNAAVRAALDAMPLAKHVPARLRQEGGTHYTSKSIQPWDVVDSALSKEEAVGFYRGNIIKYVMRCNDKGGVEDLKKAHHYLEKLLEVLST